jgi:hypothetical protein
MESCGLFTITWQRFIGRILWKFLQVSLLIMNDWKSGGRCFLNVLVRKWDFLICYDYPIRVFSIFHW